MKCGISSLMDSSVTVCTAIQYSVLAGTTEVKLLSRQRFVQHSGTLLFPRRQRQSVSIHSCCSTRFCVDFHISDEDNQVIDYFPGVVPVRGCTVLIGYLNVNTPRLFLNSSPTQPHFRSILAMMPGVLGLLCDDSSTCSTILGS